MQEAKPLCGVEHRGGFFFVLDEGGKVALQPFLFLFQRRGGGGGSAGCGGMSQVQESLCTSRVTVLLSVPLVGCLCASAEKKKNSGGTKSSMETLEGVFLGVRSSFQRTKPLVT